MNETDELIYERFLKEGNEEDLLILLERHKESLILFLYGFVKDMDMAEELAIDSYAEAAAGRTFFALRSSFKTWLFSIGKNLALTFLRKMRRVGSFSSGQEKYGEEDESFNEYTGDIKAGAEYDPELIILRNERNKQLYAAMEKIKDDYRQILILCFFEEMTYEEAGKVMGRNRKQVYNLVERGKTALKKELLKTGFEYEIGV